MSDFNSTPCITRFKTQSTASCLDFLRSARPFSTIHNCMLFGFPFFWLCIIAFHQTYQYSQKKEKFFHHRKISKIFLQAFWLNWLKYDYNYWLLIILLNSADSGNLGHVCFNILQVLMGSRAPWLWGPCTGLFLITGYGDCHFSCSFPPDFLSSSMKGLIKTSPRPCSAFSSLQW